VVVDGACQNGESGQNAPVSSVPASFWNKEGRTARREREQASKNNRPRLRIFPSLPSLYSSPPFRFSFFLSFLLCFFLMWVFMFLFFFCFFIWLCVNFFVDFMFSPLYHRFLPVLQYAPYFIVVFFFSLIPFFFLLFFLLGLGRFFFLTF